MPDTFFILPSAEAGDARDELFISIEGKVHQLSAAGVAALLQANKDALEHLEYLSRFTKQVSLGVMSQLRAARVAGEAEPKGDVRS